MMNKSMKHTLYCPICVKGKVLLTRIADAEISVRCPRCKHYFIANLLTLETEAAQAQ